MSRPQPDLSHLTDQYDLTEEEFAKTLDAVMASHNRRDDLWVFGYGSLMWRPDFPHLERQFGVVHGYHRAFCIYSHVHRGTRARPGLVLGLDNGGSCKGVAYRVRAADAEAVVEYLIQREMVTRVYTPRWVTVRIGDRTVRAHTYTAAHNHVQYAGKLTPEQAADCIRNNNGRSGNNSEYLRNTVTHFEELGIDTAPLLHLQRLVAGG
jgi:cation transport protein ChaC